MAEFCVTYACDECRYLALVIVPERPAMLQFDRREDLHAAIAAAAN